MRWASTFQYLPIEFDAVLAETENRTQRVSIRNNLNGSKVRILLSNRYGKQPLKIDHMTVMADRVEKIREEEQGNLRGRMNSGKQNIGGRDVRCAEVTLEGKASFVLEPGEEIFSDEISLEVHAGERLAVSVYTKGRQTIESVCTFSTDSQTHISWNREGDGTEQAVFCPEAGVEEIFGPESGFMFYGFSAVQVYTEESVQVIAAFGDSITHMSYVTNDLMDRLYRTFPGMVSLINCGISGNRLVHDATFHESFPANGKIFGEAGVKRFEKDVFGIGRTDVVLVLEGINDIMHPIQFEGAARPASPEDMEAGFCYLTETARAHGCRIFGATITPSGSEAYPESWIEAFEESRCAVNAWLRKDPPFDGVFDYDLGVRDPQRPDYMREDCSIGDGLHPNAEGARRMVDQIDLELLVRGGSHSADDGFCRILLTDSK